MPELRAAEDERKRIERKSRLRDFRDHRVECLPPTDEMTGAEESKVKITQLHGDRVTVNTKIPSSVQCSFPPGRPALVARAVPAELPWAAGKLPVCGRDRRGSRARSCLGGIRLLESVGPGSVSYPSPHWQGSRPLCSSPSLHSIFTPTLSQGPGTNTSHS